MSDVKNDTRDPQQPASDTPEAARRKLESFYARIEAQSAGLVAPA